MSNTRKLVFVMGCGGMGGCSRLGSALRAVKRFPVPFWSVPWLDGPKRSAGADKGFPDPDGAAGLVSGAEIDPVLDPFPFPRSHRSPDPAAGVSGDRCSWMIESVVSRSRFGCTGFREREEAFAPLRFDPVCCPSARCSFGCSSTDALSFASVVRSSAAGSTPSLIACSSSCALVSAAPLCSTSGCLDSPDASDPASVSGAISASVRGITLPGFGAASVSHPDSCPGSWSLPFKAVVWSMGGVFIGTASFAGEGSD
mgnify:CR=1 FL=1